MHEAQDGQRRCTLVIAQAEMLFQVADGQLDREPGPINFDDLEGRQRPVRADQDGGFFGPLEHQVVYPSAADNSIGLKTGYNVPYHTTMRGPGHDWEH